MSAQNLHHFFDPQSIALIGASRTKGSVGNALVKNLVSGAYSGKVYLVNPNADSIENHVCYTKLAEVPEKVDLAILAVPAALVPSVLQECGANGIQNICIISAGFREIGNLDLENQLNNLIEQYQFNLLGPNCLGFINNTRNLNASFAASTPPPGKIGFFSQSGALCTAIIDMADSYGLGFSKFISTGNKNSLDEVALLEYFLEDQTTEIVAFYCEDLKDGARFLAAAEKLSKQKPVIAIKAGRTEEGSAAAMSHTGSLAGSDQAFRTLFQQAGVKLASNIEEFLLILQTLSFYPPSQGTRTAIITNAGGPGVIAADAISNQKLQLAKLSPATTAQLSQSLPAAASTKNPIDLLGDARADRYQRALEIVLKDENVDQIMVILTPQAMTEIEATAKIIIQAKQNSPKPIICSFIGGGSMQTARQLLQKNRISCHLFPETAAQALANLVPVKHSPSSNSPSKTPDSKRPQSVQTILNQAEQNNQKTLTEEISSKILAAYNFPLLAHQIVHSEAESQKFCQQLGKPAVFKINSPDISHKSDVGGVITKVSETTAIESFRKIITNVKKHRPDARISGVLAVEMADLQAGVELIVGAKYQPNLGHLIMVGLGGIYVEIFQDFATAFAPLDDNSANELITKLKCYPLLHGARNQQAYDLEELKKLLLKLSQLLSENPEIAEIDLNPVLLYAANKGAICLDARIILR